ncbi:RcnB family protein [Blastomonas sp.]|uniref:RcnB family protein n=1 Tax=Blastomonas sp. TaxID=1909299 RepID=UPI00406A34BA
MKSRAFAMMRHAAIGASLLAVAATAMPAQAADSSLERSASGWFSLSQASALKGTTVVRPGYGMRFPVGAPAYVRPFRGFILPRVWIAPTYYIANWQGYRLPRPAPGYGWSRYYDDAVLTDRQGRVYDTVQGVNWQAAPGATTTVVQQTYSPDYDPYNYDDSLLLGNDDVVEGTHWSRDADMDAGVDYDPDLPPPPPPPAYAPVDDRAFLEACRRDNGLGGAAAGAAVGGLAGNRIAGRGNRTGGTLIGAGVGALAGMVIDKAEDRERCKRLLAAENAGGYGTRYASPPPPPPVAAPGYAPPPPPPPATGYAQLDDRAFLEICRRDNGLGGAAIGAGIGGLAGNRIAGRGNRTGGTLIGAGVGALAGMLIDKAEDRERCKRLLAQQGAVAPGQPGGYPPPPPGYYYYYPPPIVTTITITPGSCNCNETVVVTEGAPAHHAPVVHHRSKNVRVYRK